jgi:hypothetical protein
VEIDSALTATVFFMVLYLSGTGQGFLSGLKSLKPEIRLNKKKPEIAKITVVITFFFMLIELILFNEWRSVPRKSSNDSATQGISLIV